MGARLAQATREFNKVAKFWSHASIPTSLKLKIYKSIFYPMLSYNLHHVWLTQSMRQKLDAWQARTLRRVLRIKASMISRISNARVLKEASTIPLSHIVRQRRLQYLGHVLRREPLDSIASVCFDNTWKVRTPYAPRKRGRPIDNWTRKSVAEALHHARSVPVARVRPGESLNPSTSGVLVVRRVANLRLVWGRHVAVRADAPRVGPGSRRRRASVAQAIPARGAR